jgi:hypothetical protein
MYLLSMSFKFNKTKISLNRKANNMRYDNQCFSFKKKSFCQIVDDNVTGAKFSTLMMHYVVVHNLKVHVNCRLFHKLFYFILFYLFSFIFCSLHILQYWPKSSTRPNNNIKEARNSSSGKVVTWTLLQSIFTTTYE